LLNFPQPLTPIYPQLKPHTFCHFNQTLSPFLSVSEIPEEQSNKCALKF